MIKETKSELQLQRQALKSMKENLASQRESVPTIRSELDAVETQACGFRAELGTPLQVVGGCGCMLNHFVWHRQPSFCALHEQHCELVARVCLHLPRPTSLRQSGGLFQS